MKMTAALTVQPGLPTVPPTATTLSRIIRVRLAVQSRGMPMTIGQISSSKRAICSLSVGVMSLRSACAISRRWPWTTTDSWLFSSVAVDARMSTWAEAGAARVEVSDDAGGYVCERAYYELLETGRRLERPALFLHVPPAGEIPPAAQAPIVRALVAACLGAA